MKTTMDASSASSTVMTMTFAPLFFSCTYCDTMSTMSLRADSSSRNIRSNGTELTSFQSVLLQLFGMNSRRNTAIE